MILITGDRGFIGSELKRYFEVNGKKVHGIDWADRGKTWTQSEAIEWIFHMGAISETNVTDWDALVQQNIEDTQNWIEFAEIQGCGITYASTASVYGPWVGSPEWGPLQPQHYYGVSKLAIDNWVSTRKWEIPVQGVRFFNVYGRNEGHKNQPSPIRRFIEQAITQRKLTVWNHDGRLGSRDFISVDDCIDAMMTLKDNKVSGVFNIGTGKQLTFMDIAQSIQRKLGVENIPVHSVPMPDEMVKTYQWESLAHLDRLHGVIPNWNPLTVDEWLDINFQSLYNQIQEELNNGKT
jgi:ADP-L-glycero-D-manno-heptose 6-epimerase